MSGFRASLNQYTRGSVRNELNFYKSDNGVKLNIEVIFIIVCILHFRLILFKNLIYIFDSYKINYNNNTIIIFYINYLYYFICHTIINTRNTILYLAEEK